MILPFNTMAGILERLLILVSDWLWKFSHMFYGTQRVNTFFTFELL